MSKKQIKQKTNKRVNKTHKIVNTTTPKEQATVETLEERNARLKRIGFQPGKSGNPAGRAKGSVSITTQIKKELLQCPEGESKQTYLDMLVKRILRKSILEGNEQMIKSVWAYVDGLPKQHIHMEHDIENILSPAQLAELLARRTVLDEKNTKK